MAKSPVDEKKRLEKLRKKIKETEKAAYMRGTPEYTDEEYEKSPEEKTAQRKLKRLNKKLDRLKPASSSLENSPLNKGKKVKVTLPSGKVVELDTRSSEYKSLIKNKKNKNIKSIVEIKDGRYTGMSTSGETQM